MNNYEQVTLIRPACGEIDLGVMVEEARRTIVLGWGGEALSAQRGASGSKDEQLRKELGALLPQSRSELFFFRLRYGWEPREIAQIALWLKETARSLRLDAESLRRAPRVKVLDPANPCETIEAPVVGDTALIRQAECVEEIASRWLPLVQEGVE